MSIVLADERPKTDQKGARANFSWTLAEPWDDRRLAAFLMTKHRRREADWTRRASPFYASLGQSTIECSVPVGSTDSLAELEKLLTKELLGILTGASQIHDDMLSSGWRGVTPP